MANRFLDTNYYKSPFVRGLKGSLKSLYSFIICDCDGAGIWHLDLQAASLFTGFEITQQEFETHFVITGKAISIGQNRFFFPDFIEHQYPKGLQQGNPAHKNFISILKKFDLIDENLIVKKGASKGLQSPIGNGNGIGQGNGIGNGNSDTHQEKLIVPKMCSIWYEHFPVYTSDRENDYAGMGKILQFIYRQAPNPKDIQELSTQEKVINTLHLIADQVEKEPFWVNKPIKSIANNIQEFYNHIKNPLNGKSGSGTSGNKHISSYKTAGQDTFADRLKGKVAKKFNQS